MDWEDNRDEGPSSLLIEADWTYTKRRVMQEVIPNLYLGPYSCATKSKCEQLDKIGITHLVCVRQEEEAHIIKPNKPEMFDYLVLNIRDSVTENIIQHFSKVKKFIDGCFNQGGKALVYSNAGISRSAAIVIAYVMECSSLDYWAAFRIVQSKRFCINPNEGFVQQLKEYVPIYRAKNQLGNVSVNRTIMKRNIDEMISTTE